MATYVVIPARYHSSRLPGKPLMDIAGKPMIQHVYEQASKASVDDVIIATDDERIVNAVKTFGGHVCLTKVSHQSGTERISEVIQQCNMRDTDTIVNIQGDEPFISLSLIEQLIKNLQEHAMASVATLCEPIKRIEDLFSPNVAKVLMDQKGYALYFSRAPIPWYRDGFALSERRLPEAFIYYRHLGVYAYPASFVKQYVQWEASPVEKIESLEQLRVLWYGHKIHVEIAVESIGPGIDTAEDLERARKQFEIIR